MTLVFKSANYSPSNALLRLASVGGVLVGFFLLLAAYGHFSAVWLVIDGRASGSGSSRFVLLLPGLILAMTGLINMGLCRVLWIGMGWALQLALFFNVLALIYVTYLLLSQVVPGHPIGMFVALVSSYLVLLGAIRVGLVWPSVVDG